VERLIKTSTLYDTVSVSIRRLFKGYYKHCECGCGYLIKCIKRNGKFVRFVSGHNKKGINNPNWKGGRYLDKLNGYWMLYIPDYFSADERGFMREHVYFYQEYHKVCVLPWAVVHHIDENKQNNMPWNLQGMTRKQHTKLHNPKLDTSDRFCSKCENKTSIKNTGDEH
jgi:hypothetical protein